MSHDSQSLDDIEAFNNSPLFKKMVADAPAVLEEARAFDERYADLIKHDHVMVGTILRCHLVVEHFLNEYLTHAHPAIVNLESMRLTFANKLLLAQHPKTSIAMALPGLQCLNKLRNQLAHRLDVAISPVDLQPIQDFVRIWRTAGGDDVPEGLAAVQDFTLTACIFISGATGVIQRHGKGRGLVGMLEWYAEGEVS